MTTIQKILNQEEMERIAAAGDAIYEERKRGLVDNYHGYFPAINIDTKKIYVDEDSSQLAAQILEHCPDGVFHIFVIGYDTTFEMRTHYGQPTAPDGRNVA